MLGLLMEMKVRCHLGRAAVGRRGMADGEDQVLPDCEAGGHGACADTDASGRDGRACQEREAKGCVTAATAPPHDATRTAAALAHDGSHLHLTCSAPPPSMP
jgi:hypothetical protein